LCIKLGDEKNKLFQDANLIETMNNKVQITAEIIRKVYDAFEKDLELTAPFLYNDIFWRCDPAHNQNMYHPYWYHPDHLGSSSYITNLDGEINQHLEYLPFGETLVDEHLNSYNSPYKFNAKELDPETGNYYYGARYYNPKWSLWLGVDEYYFKYPSLSPYIYTANNPINYVDPDGRKIVPWKKERSFLGFSWTTYPGLASDYGSDVKFDRAYSSLNSSSSLFSSSISRLENSDRTYRFRTEYKTSGSYSKHRGSFDPSNQTINFTIDLKNDRTFAGNHSTVFEEVIHAAQYDYYSDCGIVPTSIQYELEAKLAKNIEGVDGLSRYETMNIDTGIFENIRNGVQLSNDQLSELTEGIKDLERNIRRTGSYRESTKGETFNPSTDLMYIEQHYGQKLSTE